MKKLFLAAPILAASVTANASMVLTGVFDGPLPGGLPKGFEIYVTEDIPDITIYGLGSANNGGGSDGQEFTFSGTSVDAGTYLYVTSNIDGFAQFFEFEPEFIFQAGAANINGDDAIELFRNGEVIDLFGDINVDGTGEPWEYLDGWAYRVSDSVASSVFNLTEWTFSGRNALDGESTNATAATAVPLATFVTDGSGGGDPTPPPLDIGACFSDATLISAVQGDGFNVTTSDDVIVEGIVTGFRDNGYFLQEEPSDSDNNSATSEGIFIFATPAEGIEVGDVARVLGAPSDFFGDSQISASQQIDCGIASEFITPVVIPVQFDDVLDIETVEGMVATINDATIFSLDNFTRFGEIFLSDSVKFNPSDVAVPLSAEFEAAQENLSANIIYLEDDNGQTFPDEISYYATPEFDGLDYSNAPRVGETVSATGPVRFAFGEYRINPTKETFFIESNRTDAPDVIDGDVSIASFNVLNYFNGEVLENGEVTFDFAANRGAESAEELALQEARIVDALITLDADVVGLIEVENDGFGEDSAIRQLVNAVNAKLGSRVYRFARSNDTSITGTDAISNAVIYKHRKVIARGGLRGIALPTQDNNGRFVGQRNTLVQSFRHRATGDRFAVAVNHFKSKGSTCFEDDNNPTELDSIQGSCGAFRVSTSVALGNALEAMNLPEKVLIIGDLNTYSQEDALAILTDYTPEERGYTITSAVNTELDGGLSVPVTDTFGYIPVKDTFDPEGFSFYFFGDDQIGSLDHVLASPAAFDAVVDLDHWNINSVELFQLTYDQALRFNNGAQGDLIDFTAVGPYRSSDHDPVVVTLELENKRKAKFKRKLRKFFKRYFW
ncbi:ExeM/NucH family extracellular endonuclease [Sessilibacter corallicola]|uniref:ExeM/NucH family extracellular endonuclease n=1 Tax=Sessilibacter corallicola TaxID=2904075 RepID=A0ABQ0A9G6_9GAMM|nr:ExeM/NucH family extracellular endonuclease [Sessilibacter corallicola]MCE2030317.1 ExeM/NucH family extracellular endonuclease [Sessilibacter corallicola]